LKFTISKTYFSNLYKLFSLARMDVWEFTEETHLSVFVTTWQSQMPTPDIEPWSQHWKSSTLSLYVLVIIQQQK